METAKVAFLIISSEADRARPGLIMASRLHANRGADVRVLFFGPGVALAASGKVDSEIEALREAEILPRACRANVESFKVEDQIASRDIELTNAGGDVIEFATQGYTVLTF